MISIKIKTGCDTLEAQYRSQSAIAAALAELENFFDGLPLLQPWVWELLAVMGAVIGFAAGVSLAMWASFTIPA